MGMVKNNRKKSEKKKKKISKKFRQSYMKQSKRTFLSENENSFDEYQTDIPKANSKRDYPTKNFFTDQEGKTTFHSRKINKIREENEKIDMLYFAVLDKIDS